jgi:hypothetical protein
VPGLNELMDLLAEWAAGAPVTVYYTAVGQRSNLKERSIPDDRNPVRPAYPTSVIITADLLASARCSSGVNVKPQGLRPRVLYFSSTDIFSLNAKNGCSYRMHFTLPGFAIR